MVATALPGTFGAKLQAELEARNMGARTLAKLLTREYGGSVENRRRTIIRWLHGATPVEENRELIEGVLGLTPGSLKDDAGDQVLSPISISLDLDRLFKQMENRITESVIRRMEAVR